MLAHVLKDVEGANRGSAVLEHPLITMFTSLIRFTSLVGDFLHRLTCI